jgi:hypothetical protein
MDKYLTAQQNKREEIKKEIRRILDREEVVFAYVYGSFLDASSFRDIDVGVYVKEIEREEIFNYELRLAQESASATGLPFDVFDVRVLNLAPYSFLNNIFRKGEVLLSRDDNSLSDLIEKTSLFAVANEYISELSFKELTFS